LKPEYPTGRGKKEKYPLKVKKVMGKFKITSYNKRWKKELSLLYLFLAKGVGVNKQREVKEEWGKSGIVMAAHNRLRGTPKGEKDW